MAATALVTGCSSGNGRATALAFLEDGWQVHATARNPGELAALEDAGAAVAELDVTSDADVARVVDEVVDERGGIDCLVNNAGFGQMGPVEDVPIEKVRAQYDVNLFGPHRLMRAVLPHMREQGSGTVVNVSSITDRFPLAGSSPYSGSKAALATATQALRQEVRDLGIDVVVVEPALVATDFYDRMRAEMVDVDHRAAYTDLYEVLELLHTVKSGGPGIAAPEDVAETILAAANSDAPRKRYTVGSLGLAGGLAAALVPESMRTPVLHAGVRLAATGPGRRLLAWWFAGHHRAEPSDRRAPPAERRP